MKEGGEVVITGLTRSKNEKSPKNKKTNSWLTCNGGSFMVHRSWYIAQRLKSRNSFVVIYHVTVKHILITGNVGETFFRFMLTSKISSWDVNAISGLVRKR